MISLESVKERDTVIWVVWEETIEPEWFPAIYLGEENGNHYVRIFTSYVPESGSDYVKDEIAICTGKMNFGRWLEREGRLDYPFDLEGFVFAHHSVRNPFDLKYCFHTEEEAIEECIKWKEEKISKLKEILADKTRRLFYEHEATLSPVEPALVT